MEAFPVQDDIPQTMSKKALDREKKTGTHCKRDHRDRFFAGMPPLLLLPVPFMSATLVPLLMLVVVVVVLVLPPTTTVADFLAFRLAFTFAIRLCSKAILRGRGGTAGLVGVILTVLVGDSSELDSSWPAFCRPFRRLMMPAALRGLMYFPLGLPLPLPVPFTLFCDEIVGFNRPPRVPAGSGSESLWRNR
uniref:Uncharacterized protein n=1 Tax=Anopheles atroparvus TaxID=41427 RepID=A0A182JN17_ANOAO